MGMNGVRAEILSSPQRVDPDGRPVNLVEISLYSLPNLLISFLLRRVLFTL